MNNAFYPAFTPTPATLTFDDWDAEQIISSHGMMFSNETFWRVITRSPVSVMLKAAQRRLEQSGWKTRHLSKGEQQPYLSMTRDEEHLDIFVARRTRSGHPFTARFDGNNDAPTPEPKTVYVHYLDRLSSSELRNAVDRQLDAGGPLDSLLLLSTKLSQDQRDRYLKLLEQQDPSSSKAWRTLAEEYFKSKQEGKARNVLRRAHWLARFDPATKNQTDETKKLAKKLKVEELLKERLTPELFQEFSIVELKDSKSTAAVEVVLNQPAFF